MIQYTRARRETQTDLGFSNKEKKKERKDSEKIGRRRNQRATVVDRRYMASESAKGSRRLEIMTLHCCAHEQTLFRLLPLLTVGYERRTVWRRSKTSVQTARERYPQGKNAPTLSAFRIGSPDRVRDTYLTQLRFRWTFSNARCTLCTHADTFSSTGHTLSFYKE